MSIAAAIGTCGAIARMRRSSSPSPSSWLCVTMAPCKSSSTPSQPCATASQMCCAMWSNAQSSTGPLGHALAAIGTTNSAPALSASSMNAASAEPVPR